MKTPLILAYDFGTGGIKASLYDADGGCQESFFASYETYYPRDGWHEQSPADWWKSVVQSTKQLLAVGGGSRSDFWMQMYADIYQKTMVRTNVDQQAAALGAAAIAAVGTGIWDDFSRLDRIHEVKNRRPASSLAAEYKYRYSFYRKAVALCGELASGKGNHE